MIYELLKSIFKRKEYHKIPKGFATTEYAGYIVTGVELPVKPLKHLSKQSVRAIRYPGSHIFFDKRTVHKFLRENLTERPFDFFKVYRVTIYPLDIPTEEKIEYEYDLDKGDFTYYIRYSENRGGAQIEYDVSIDEDITFESKVETVLDNRTN